MTPLIECMYEFSDLFKFGMPYFDAIELFSEIVAFNLEELARTI